MAPGARNFTHMILALLQEMSNSSAAVQGNHLSAAGTSLHHHSTRAVRRAVVAYHQRWRGHRWQVWTHFSVNKRPLFLETLEQCDIRPWTGSECNWETIRKHDFKNMVSASNPHKISTVFGRVLKQQRRQKWQIIATSKRLQICLIFGVQSLSRQRNKGSVVENSYF